MTSTLDKVRLDKWLWAARFFKTRSLAKKAIEGGKVHCNGARSKSSREIETEYLMSNNFAFGGINTSLIFRRV